jgi:high affinity Mn2+ porin
MGPMGLTRSAERAIASRRARSAGVWRGDRPGMWRRPLWMMLVCAAAPALAFDASELLPHQPIPYLVGGQSTVIWQWKPAFTSPYQGPHSLQSQTENAVSDTYTLYTGIRPYRWLEFYIDPEMVRGHGLSDALGLAGFTNGEVIRNPDIGMDPYLARAFLRATWSLGEETESRDTDQLQIGGDFPTSRLAFIFGVLATNDLFDTNRYANNARTQFMNWALITDPAYDFAADTRGYSRGIALEWAMPVAVVRAGVFQMPVVANGLDLDSNLLDSNGEQLEVDVPIELLAGRPLVARGLFYANHANMGNYRAAIALGRQTGQPPNITLTEKPGTLKYGFAFNFEQPLFDDGETGLFGRAGWDDGATESFAFTECDRHVSLGAQIAGASWHRPADHLGIAVVVNGLSDPHADYLAAGGLGFILGDGRLHRGAEIITEAYYSLHVLRWFDFSLDYQFIDNPGYNQDRGPVSVLSLRGHVQGEITGPPPWR